MSTKQNQTKHTFALITFKLQTIKNKEEALLFQAPQETFCIRLLLQDQETQVIRLTHIEADTESWVRGKETAEYVPKERVRQSLRNKQWNEGRNYSDKFLWKTI